MQRKRGQSSIKRDGLFSGGWIKCATCGCNVVYDPKKKKIKDSEEERVHHYYHCTNSKKQHETMKGLSISEEKILQQFESTVGSLTISRNFAEQISQALNEISQRAKAKIMKEAEGYNVALKELEGREDKIYDDLKASILDDVGYRRQLQRLRDERAHYTRLLHDANFATTDAVIEKAETILELAINAQSHWESMNAPERREFLNKLLSNPVLDGPTVRFDLKKPFMWLVKNPENSKWRARYESNVRPSASEADALSN
jgi:hypothetical protein